MTGDILMMPMRPAAKMRADADVAHDVGEDVLGRRGRRASPTLPSAMVTVKAGPT